MASGNETVFVEISETGIYYVSLYQNKRQERMSFAVFTIDYPVKKNSVAMYRCFIKENNKGMNKLLNRINDLTLLYSKK